MNNIPYLLSKDYEKLYDIVANGGIAVGFTKYSGSTLKDVVKITASKLKQFGYNIGCRGIQYGGTNTDNIDEFVSMCEQCDLEYIESTQSIPTVGVYQHRIGMWLIECFGEEIAKDSTERSFRFLEEGLELVQSLGVTKEQALKLVDYVFDRPVGETKQEVGGVMVTLAALCYASGISLGECARDEYLRILSKIDKIRAKHHSKPKDVLSPIPGNNPE